MDTTKELKIISWNICFDDINFNWRNKTICDEILKYSPDIICLQEVTHPAWIIIQKKLSMYTSAYTHPFLNNTSDRVYGEVILSKFPILSKQFITLKSDMGRVCTQISIEFNDKLLYINTAHLESFDYKFNERKTQLNQIISLNSSNTNWLLIGDTNLTSSEIYSNLYSPSSPTYFSNRSFNDCKLESNLCLKTEFYDKLLLNSTDFSLSSISTIGSKKISKKWLSDHDGLLVILLCNCFTI